MLYLLVGLVIILFLGFMDYATGRELTFFQFYILPIALLTWLVGRWPGIAAALTSALIWYIVDTLGGNLYSIPVIAYWNAASRLLIFLLTSMIVHRYRQALQAQIDLGRLDGLTGAINSTYFTELLHKETKRNLRNQQSLTLVYLDLDNFKQVNDIWGHTAGDTVLQVVVHTVRAHLRETDSIGRMGGDEFALLLPETRREAAQVAIQRLRELLLAEMQRYGWPVTFSIGVLTCVGGTCSANELVQQADHLMYTIKRATKNAIAYQEI